jgi:plasmid stabilization system protein ParE
MRLRWSEDAVNDLERITDYLFAKAPERAPQLVREIYEAPAGLLMFPLSWAARKKLRDSRTRAARIAVCDCASGQW